MAVLRALAVTGYRSIRDLVVPLGPLTVVTGPNGSGKSSLYRALRLLAATARGGLVPSLAREGGLASTFWAGPETIGAAVRAGRHPVQGTARRNPAQLRLGFAADEFSYGVDLGYPSPIGSAFDLDPEIKRECIWSGPVFRPASLLVDRAGPALRCTNDEGSLAVVGTRIARFESMLTAYADPRGAPEMILVRERIRSWRFYDHFRTDPEAPCRSPQVATHTPVLGDDGGDLAAALQTILEIGDPGRLAAVIEDAFPGSSLEILRENGRFEVAMRQHGMLRPLRAAELSDGTIRTLLLAAALLTPRPPELLVLNEPETSLHPDLIPPLGRLIRAAAAQAQTIIVTHSGALAELLAADASAETVALEKSFGETRAVCSREEPRWAWPKR